jgi:F0F1-type ATP synthase assembly protein I
MIEPGRVGAYLALFSEIGFVLLVTTLGGTLLGYWIDGQLHTVPIFALAGFFLGGGIGTFGIYRLVTRFLARFE